MACLLIPKYIQRPPLPLPFPQPMRWITFLILLAVMAAFQIARFLSVPHASSAPWPEIEYLVILTVFYALFADDQHAPLCGLAAGALLDLINPVAILGTSAFTLGLIAWAIVRIRLSIFRENLGSKIVMTVIAVIAYGFIAALLRTVAPQGGPTFWRQLLIMAGNAAYSGLAAPVLFWLFFKIRPLLGFGIHGPRSR